MKSMIIAVTLLLCSLPSEAARQRAVSPEKRSCVASGGGVPCLAFVSERDGNPEIYVMNGDGTGLLRLTDHAGYDGDPAWSPDGSRIAFVSDRAGGQDVYVMDADGSNVVRRTDDGLNGLNAAPAWSPDGKTIVFSSLRGGQFRLYLMSVDEDWVHPTPVGFDRGWNTHPAWSPDGVRIAFVSDSRAYDFVYDVYVMNADGSQITPLFATAFRDLTYFFQPSFSPDGGRVAVVVCGYTRPHDRVLLADLSHLRVRAAVCECGWQDERRPLLQRP